MPRVDHEEEPYTLKQLREQDEWYRVYQSALQEGHDDDTAKEIADVSMEYKRVGPEVLYGVSRDD